MHAIILVTTNFANDPSHFILNTDSVTFKLSHAASNRWTHLDNKNNKVVNFSKSVEYIKEKNKKQKNVTRRRNDIENK